MDEKWRLDTAIGNGRSELRTGHYFLESSPTVLAEDRRSAIPDMLSCWLELSGSMSRLVMKHYFASIW